MKRSALPPLYLYDDPADVGRFLPFSQSRPIGELPFGAHLLRERCEQHFLPVAGYVAAPHLARFAESGAPAVVSPPTRPALFLRSSFVLDHHQDVALFTLPQRKSGAGSGIRFVDSDGETVGAGLPGSEWRGPAGIRSEWPAVALKGKRLTGAWQIVADLMSALAADLEAVGRRRRTSRAPSRSTVLGKATDLYVDKGAAIEPYVVFDTRPGPIWIREQAEVQSFSRLQGPLVVGRGTRVAGGDLKGSSIGPRCVVRGEISTSVLLGYANKAHEGFLGHSIVGRWVNLGAGTTTSNLKNTYGTVRLNLGTERVETGMTFLGSLIGDHVKTAIGTMLPTGSVIGTGANVFGTKRPDAHVPAFAWGTEEPGRLVACRMFLQTAARVLPRRDVSFDDAMKAYLTDVWRHCTGEPCD